MAGNDSGKIRQGNKPVHLGDWVQANRPNLHSTRRKVLKVVSQLSREDSWTNSSEVRQTVGISQQLLNRHLRGLEEDGLVNLDKPGPGLPLNIQITSAGLRALGLRGPHPTPSQAPEPETHDEPLAPEPTPAYHGELPEPTPATAAQVAPQVSSLPAVQLSRQAYEFLEKLYNTLAPFLQGIERRDYYYLTAPALRKRPVVAALFEALSHYLPGLGAVDFKEIVANLAGVAQKPAGDMETRPQQPGQRQLRVVEAEPPELSPAEQALEEQLSRAVNPEYRGMEWHQRTRLLSDEWDRARRRRLGLFRTTFTTFGPRWQRPDWSDFNQARRQADHRGADYGEWVAVQFDRLAPGGEREVKPSELHGERAVAAYLEYRHEESGEKSRELGPPPYTPQSFSTHDPVHLAYAERLIMETIALAERIMTGDPEGPARLLAQAVRSGALPMASLDLAPQQRQEVMNILQRDAGQYQQVRTMAAPQPKVII